MCHLFKCSLEVVLVECFENFAQEIGCMNGKQYTFCNFGFQEPIEY